MDACLQFDSPVQARYKGRGVRLEGTVQKWRLLGNVDTAHPRCSIVQPQRLQA